ncbi:MAG: HAD family phosphatase [Armatimonadetes bacterium]|nr:HAD family phosphatase [Armatimonadota bacterium]
MPLAELPAAAIFDCDGTLVDTMPTHFRAWRETLDAAGHPTIFPETQFYEWAGTTATAITERLNEIHGLALHPESTAAAKEELFATLLVGVEPVAPVVAEARRLFALGVPLAVASGGWRAVVDESLRAIGIRDLFVGIVGSEDVTHGKPAPEVFLRAAELLNTAPEKCVVFEDAAGGILAAHRAGMKCVDITKFL